MLGFVFSQLGNAVFEGGWVPGVLIAMLPTWTVAFRSTFGTVSDFLSPFAGYVVERFGAFTSLAFTEGLEGVLCLILALIPAGWVDWKWLLLTLACLLLITGQIIDVASEVFEVDAANGDGDMLIRYSGFVGILASIFGTLVGNTLGAALAAISLQIMLLVSALTSLACAATRFATRHMINDTMSDHATIQEKADATSKAVQSQPASEQSGESNVQPTNPPDATTHNDQSDTTPHNPATAPWQQFGLLTCSSMLAFISSVWVSYSILILGQQYGHASMSAAYAFLGAGSVLGSFIFAGISTRLTMRITAMAGVALTIIGLLIQLPDALPVILIGMLLTQLGYSVMVQPVILSRQLIFKHHGLARFSGYSRFAFALAGAAGSWVGWLTSGHRPLLVLIALGGSLAFLAATRFLVGKRPTVS